ncbi:hypothetical protein [Mucilaginibacter sp. L196]|uniref:hypothetical protein n=1 Tax=Mucilaginibacter sp. L196 TaxID=1641870 RepID=UPI00131CA2EC|nr:hypothetical protein [Mucilaginibacter sp. L196]
MCITGYDNKAANGGCFQVLNSYGKKRGSGGYIYIPYYVFKKWAIAAFVIDNDPHDPPSLAKVKDGNPANNTRPAAAPASPNRTGPR